MKESPKNYDLPNDNFPFNNMNNIDPDLNQYFKSEDIYNTEFMKTNQISQPPHNYYHTGTDIFLASNLNFIDMDDIYEDFSEYD